MGNWFQDFGQGLGILGNILGGQAGTNFWNIIGKGIAATGSGLWSDITGMTNTKAQNDAAAALQEDSQAFNSEESQKQRDFEAEQAQINRDWQEQMSNSAYQRSVADLKAAGLNPWLAVGNGASTPSAVSVVGDAASSGISSAQASNVNLLQSLGTTAAGLGLLIKALKVAAK